jgi:hypothetical protein
MRDFGQFIYRQDSPSSTVTTRDWVQASSGFSLLAYLEVKEPLKLSNNSVFTRKGEDDLSNEAFSSNIAYFDSITEAMNEICEEVDTHLDPALAAASHRTLARSEW